MTAVAVEPTVALAPPRSPYRGLTPFGDSELDALLFFGRRYESDVIAENLVASPLTVLYGPSGVGKSSVLRAGVATALREGGLGGAEAVVAFVASWAGSPLAELLGAPVEPGLLADAVTSWAARQGRETYLILDQFEEFFLYHDAGEAAELAEALAELHESEDFRVNVLISIREDALAKLDVFKAWLPGLFANVLRLDRLDRAAAREAIVRPVDTYNMLVEPDERVMVEPTLVAAVLDQVALGRLDVGHGGRGKSALEPEADRVEAPFLQLVMERLWDEERRSGSPRLRLATLERLGGAEQIVREHVDSALAALSAPEQEWASRLFNQLVTPSGTKIAHDAGDLARYAGAREDEVAPVLDRLTRARVLRPIAAADGRGRYEIFHDVLAQPVLAWRARHRTEREVERKLAEAHRRRRRLQLLFGLVLVGLGLMTAVTLFALSQRSQARSQRSEAQQRAWEAELRTREARALKLEALARGSRTTNPELGLLLAREAVRVARTSTSEQTLREALQAFRLRRRIRLGEPVLRSVLRGNRVISATARGSVVTSDLRTGRIRRRIQTGQPASTATFADDGSALLTGSDGRMRLVRLSGAVTTIQESFAVDGGQLAPSGRRALAYNELGAYLVDVHSGRVTKVFSRADTLAGAISRDGTLAATGHAAKTVRVWRIATAKRFLKLFTNVGDIVAVAISPRDDLVASANSKGIAQVWRIEDGTTVAVLGGHTKGLTDVGFSEDERHLVTASRDGTIGVWDVGKSARTATLRGRMKSVVSAAFAGNRTILSASGDEVRLWEARPAAALAVHGSLEELMALAGRRLAATGSMLTPAERKRYLG